MNRVLQLVVGLSVALAAACGDNAKECGANTVLENGYCVGTGGPPMCLNGTILDTATNSCVIDPNACQGGTVLIGNSCQDPTAGLTVDLTEGAEPNGAGFIEDSTTPAGEITLKPIGETFVLMGTTNPFRDADMNGQKDADYDTYFVDVTAPTLLEVSVDGIGGTMAAFIVAPSNASNPVNATASGWIRYGMNITGDASKRQILLPAAGTYVFVFADTRSIYIDADSPPAAGFDGAAGNPNAHYYASITQIAMPTPTPITVTGTGTTTGMVTGVIGNDLQFFTAPMGLGLNEVSLDLPGPANGAAVLLKNNLYKTSDDAAGGIADILTLGFAAADTATIVADFTYNYGPDQEPFTLTVKSGGATALSTTGGTVSQPLVTDSPASLFDYNVFYYDVSGADEIDGLDLTWTTPVDGLLADDDLLITANFTFDGGFFGDTWDSYVGLMRHPKAGRYYFFVYDPFGTPTTDLVEVTSTIERRVPVAVVKGTPLTGQAVDATFRSNSFTYAADTATDAWQQFNATGTGTGDLDLRWFNPTTAYGRLDALPSASFPPREDVTPVFADTFVEASATPTGRILLDDGTSNYLVIANTATTTGSPTMNLDFARRDHHDFGAVSTGGTAMRADESLDTAPVYRYLMRTTPSNFITLSVHPDNVLLDTRIQLLRATESVARTINNGAAGADDGAVIDQVANGWTAFTVSSPVVLPAGTNTFDLSIATEAPPGYTSVSTTTAYDDACTGGTVITLSDDDEGTSAAFPAPAGFVFFEAATTNITVSSNGFLVFGNSTSASFLNANIPTAAAPNAFVAPYWDDLDFVSVCQKTVGTKTTIQWEGELWTNGDLVGFQAILDTADNTIEFVYATTQVPTGASATIGAEGASGTYGHKIGFNTASTITPGAGKKLTPN